MTRTPPAPARSSRVPPSFRDEERRIGERQIGAGESRAGAAEQHREETDAQHRIAERMRRNVVVADGPQDQSGAGAVEKPARWRSPARATDRRRRPGRTGCCPTNGMSVRPGIWRCGAGSTRSPTKPAPIRPDRPTPKIVERKARRDLVDRKSRVNTAKIADMNAPARSPRARRRPPIGE